MLILAWIHRWVYTCVRARNVSHLHHILPYSLRIVPDDYRRARSLEANSVLAPNSEFLRARIIYTVNGTKCKNRCRPELCRRERSPVQIEIQHSFLSFFRPPPSPLSFFFHATPIIFLKYFSRNIIPLLWIFPRLKSYEIINKTQNDILTRFSDRTRG